ncbi:MAG: hypothetical protein NC912_04205 [Candidatus Omnitrophica bacterium]|nr:hypothetical protein [Candidatus Omnitrophota bacterium]
MRKLILFLILIFTATLAKAEILKENFSLSGYLKQETSLGLDTFNELTKFKNILSLSAEYRISEELTFFASVKGFYDAVYDWRAKYDSAQDQIGHTQRTDWLRDCYLDYISGPWFLRLGKQQVAWGQADGISVLDRVNPVDLTEYWLPDMVDIRITLWMLNINYSPKLNSNLQLLIIPDFEQSTSAPPDAPLAFRSYRLYSAWKKGKNVREEIFYPGKKFKNSTFGLQWKDMIGDLTYTLNYLYGYYYSARTYTEIYNPFLGNYYYSRRFKLWRMYGASMNKTFTNPGPLQGITLRGDFAYYNDEPTYYGVDGSSRGVNRWDNVFWLIGLDKYLFTNFLASFQFAQYIMHDAKPGIGTFKTLNAYTYGPQDQVENIFTLKLTTDFLHERLKTEVLWSFTDDNQGRLSPKATYELKDNLYLTLGIHYFYGNEQDSNGQYRDASQFYTQIKFTF